MAKCASANIYYFFISALFIFPFSQCVKILYWYFFYNLSFWFSFYNKFYPSHTSISLHRNLNVSKIILCLDCFIFMAYARNCADWAKWWFATFDATESTVRSLQIWSASRITFNARLTSTGLHNHNTLRITIVCVTSSV